MPVKEIGGGDMPPKHPEADLKSLACGSCQWFAAGYGGANCRELRKVRPDTPACTEFELPMEDPFSAAVRDKYIQGIRRQVVSERFVVESGILDELRSYIREENLNKYRFGTQQDLEGVCTYLKNIVYFRARVSNIYTGLLDVKHEFDEIASHASLWLYSKYAPVMQGLRNEAARKAALHRILPEMIEVQKQIDKTMAAAKHVDDFLDANERACSKILSSSERLWFSREHKGRSYG
jgi:hypothetical protein